MKYSGCVKCFQRYFIFILLSLSGFALAQKKDITTPPYGGKPNRVRTYIGYDRKEHIPLSFKTAEFTGNHFENNVFLASAIFNCEAHFSGVDFEGVTDFHRAVFDRSAKFTDAHFMNKAYFYADTFKGVTDFRRTVFDSAADFSEAHFMNITFFPADTFKGVTDFRGTVFDVAALFAVTYFMNTASFVADTFKGETYFVAVFDSTADFSKAHFMNRAYFFADSFKGVTDFSRAVFDSTADFTASHFMDTTDFRYTEFYRSDFARASIEGTFKLGSSQGQGFDFRDTYFYPNTKLELHGLVALDIQPEKFQYIQILDTLGYFLKDKIIKNIQDKNFKNDKKAQSELNYILAKSTKYQTHTDDYQRYKWYKPLDLLTMGKNTLYYLTMGFGYRPFRLFWWALGVIVFYLIIYLKKMPQRINAYIATNFNTPQKKVDVLRLRFFDSALNCAYFSVMLFFTFRFKGHLLTFFNTKEKRLIASEWFLGFLMYLAFITLSETGSILYNIKELFGG